MAINLNTTDWNKAGGGNNSQQIVTVTRAINVAENDVEFILFSSRGASEAEVVTPTGWTRKAIKDSDLVSWANTLVLFYKVAGTSENTTVDIDQGSSYRWGYISGRLSGDIDTSNPFDNISIAESDTPLINASILADNGDILMAMLGVSSDINNVSEPPTHPASMNLQENVVHTSSAGVTIAIATEVLASDGETGTREWSWASSSEEGGVGFLVEVNAVSSFTLTITSANGTVTKNPDKAEYNPGEIVELTADPDPGYKFDSWSGDITSTSNPVNVTMDSDKSITANYTQVDIIHPEDGATGVSLTPLLDWRPDLTFSGFDEYLVRVADNANFDTPWIIDKVVDIDEYQVLAGVFGNSTQYFMKVWGLRVNLDTTVYNEDFTGIADQVGWTSDWTTVDQAGNGNVSFDITSERARIVCSGPSVLATADLNGIDIADTTQEFLVRSNLISNNIQPSYYFRASGNWVGSKKVGYQFWFWDQKVHLVKTVDVNGTLENTILTEVATALSANTDYKIKYQTNGSLIRWKVWDNALSEPSTWNEYDDTTNPILTGRFAMKLATTASAPGTTVMEFDDFNIQQAEEIPIIDSVDAGDTQATVSYTGVANADSYEYRLDGGTATAVPNGTDNPFTITGLTNGQTYTIEMRAIVSGSPTSWSNSIQFTPEADSIVSVTIDQANADVAVGETKQLTVIVETIGSPDTSVTWASSDETVATVDSNGIVQGAGEGSCIITAISVVDNTKSDSVSSNVTQSTEPADWFSDATIEGNNSELKDKEALAKLYNDCNGTNWNNQTGWSGDPAQIDLSAGNEPFGVEAQTINSERRVTLIRLCYDGTGDPVNNPEDNQGNNLSGILPNELGNLKELKHFNVVSNGLSGNLPGGMRYCSKIEKAFFELTKSTHGGAYSYDPYCEPPLPHDNKLSGESGKQRGFDVYPHNNFSGTLPGEWSDWVKVRQLGVASTTIDSNGQATINGITGSLPPQWGNMAELQQLYLDINALSGKLPPEWAGMVELVDLYLNVNQFGSTTEGHPDAVLPSEWGGGSSYGDGMRKLRHFSVNDRISGGDYSDYNPGGKSVIMKFDGPIPENWGNMQMLHRWTMPLMNQPHTFPQFISTGQWDGRETNTSNWTGIHPSGDPTPDPDASPIQAWADQLTEIKQINQMTTLPEFDNLDLTRFNAVHPTNDFGGIQVPASLATQTRMAQLFLAGTNLTGPFPDVTGWNQCKIFEIRSNNWGNGLPEVPGASGSEWRNVQAQFGNFSGQIPASWGQLPDQTWTRLWLHGNNLSGTIPAGLADNSYSDRFYIDNNKYVFRDIVPVLSSLPNPPDLRYAPQKKFGSSQTYNRAVGESLNVDPFSGNVSHANNSYQWYKDGSPVSGETSRALSLSNLQLSDAGTYYLEVTNSQAPDLTLQSQNVTLNVS